MKKPTHGGARKGAGRKKGERKAFLVRTNPRTMEIIRAESVKRGLATPGEVLEQDYGV